MSLYLIGFSVLLFVLEKYTIKINTRRNTPEKKYAF